MLEQSLIINNCYKHREQYLLALLKRLKRIPQLLPIKYPSQIRTRLSHCLNAVRIVQQLTSGEFFVEESLLKKIKLAVLFHDIGHPPYGHAGERALNALMVDDHGFDNATQTKRLLFDKKNTKDFMGIDTIFDTEPINFFHFLDGEDQSLLDLVNFFDDLENTFGDLRDLIISYKCSRAAKLFDLLLPYSNVENSVPVLCIAYMNKYLFALPESAKQDIFSLLRIDAMWAELKKSRKEIFSIMSTHDEIINYDNKGAQFVQDAFVVIRNRLKGYYSVKEPMLNRLAADFTSAL